MIAHETEMKEIIMMLFHFLTSILPFCHHTASYCLHFNPSWAHYLATHPGAKICHV